MPECVSASHSGRRPQRWVRIKAQKAQKEKVPILFISNLRIIMLYGFAQIYRIYFWSSRESGKSDSIRRGLRAHSHRNTQIFER